VRGVGQLPDGEGEDEAGGEGAGGGPEGEEAVGEGQGPWSRGKGVRGGDFEGTAEVVGEWGGLDLPQRFLEGVEFGVSVHD
jgi:hypothetical protein